MCRQTILSLRVASGEAGILAVWLMGIPNGVERPASMLELLRPATSQPDRRRPAGAYLLATDHDQLSNRSAFCNLKAGWQRQDICCSCFSLSPQSVDRLILVVEAAEDPRHLQAARSPRPLLPVAVRVDHPLGRQFSFRVMRSLQRRWCKGCRASGRLWRQC